MSEYAIDVRITPREGLLDPQGKAVHHALESLDFPEVTDVRVGRLVRLRLSADAPEAARERADAMCRKLLANPVTEDYRIELLEGAEA
ncbi:MAG TPA: phosphoribosylformylglycinamidine synthase subunit PurS [Longimicrobiales bacterium]|nr:phosphoribosylformylglycinamidine synthase subunit PurS [Longimicrobiales bacterium]